LKADFDDGVQSVPLSAESITLATCWPMSVVAFGVEVNILRIGDAFELWGEEGVQVVDGDAVLLHHPRAISFFSAI
jgi:hypothetical protein